MLTIYGLKNCDTTRKARRWLTSREHEHRFIDVRHDGIDAKTLRGWSAKIGWEKLLNRRGTTWRSLTDEQRSEVDERKAIALMASQPALIKRPVLENKGALLVGFDEREYTALFA